MVLLGIFLRSPNLEVLTFPISKNTFCDVINQEMSRDTYKDFRLIREVKQLLTETGMVGKSYFNHRKRKVSKISAGGRIRKNNQALSYLSSQKKIVCQLKTVQIIPVKRSQNY